MRLKRLTCVGDFVDRLSDAPNTANINDLSEELAAADRNSQVPGLQIPMNQSHPVQGL